MGGGEIYVLVRIKDKSPKDDNILFDAYNSEVTGGYPKH